jgi:hypothetical protein
MKVRRGLFRIWVVGSAIWILVAAFFLTTLIARPYQLSFGEVLALPMMFLGLPLIAFLLGEGTLWIVSGFRTSEAQGTSGRPALLALGLLVLIGALGVAGVTLKAHDDLEMQKARPAGWTPPPGMAS